MLEKFRCDIVLDPVKNAGDQHTRQRRERMHVHCSCGGNDARRGAGPASPPARQRGYNEVGGSGDAPSEEDENAADLRQVQRQGQRSPAVKVNRRRRDVKHAEGDCGKDENQPLEDIAGNLQQDVQSSKQKGKTEIKNSGRGWDKLGLMGV
jgi:hypothetical protein